MSLAASSRTTPMPVSVNMTLLGRVDNLVGDMSTAQYTARVNDRVSSVGRHVRHVIDHYSSFLRDHGTTRLCYDQRARDAEIERNRASAQQALGQAIAGLDAMDLEAAAPVSLSVLGSPDAAPANVQSTLARELLFLQSHTLHHLAVIELLLAMQGVTLPTNFAAAPATVSHARTTGTRS